MTRPPAEILERALAREPASVRELVKLLTPIIQARVARAILRMQSTRKQNRSPAEEVRDMTQDVFASLFADDAKALRAWDPARGLSLVNFVGIIAEHQVASIFRSGRRRPWSDDLVADHDFETSIAENDRGPEKTMASMQSFGLLLDRLRAELTPRGFEIFHLLFIEEASVESACASTGMSTDAVYAWRSRLPKIVRKVAETIEGEQAAESARSRAAPMTGAEP